MHEVGDSEKGGADVAVQRSVCLLQIPEDGDAGSTGGGGWVVEVDWHDEGRVVSEYYQGETGRAGIGKRSRLAPVENQMHDADTPSISIEVAEPES